MMPKGVEHKAKACAADAAVLNAFRHHRVVSTALPEAPIAPSKTIAARAKRAATESLPVAAFVVLVNLFLRFVISPRPQGPWSQAWQLLSLRS